MMMLFLFILLMIAVWTDISERRIPNIIVTSGLLLTIGNSIIFFIFELDNNNPTSELINSVSGFILGFVLLLPLYIIRACGAGDVKLMAMIGAFVGPNTVAYVTLYTLLAGGILSIFFMFGRGVAAHTIKNIQFLLIDWLFRLRTGGGAKLAPLENTAARLPYAVAIAMGTGAAVWMQHH